MNFIFQAFFTNSVLSPQWVSANIPRPFHALLLPPAFNSKMTNYRTIQMFYVNFMTLNHSENSQNWKKNEKKCFYAHCIFIRDNHALSGQCSGGWPSRLAVLCLGHVPRITLRMRHMNWGLSLPDFFLNIFFCWCSRFSEEVTALTWLINNISITERRLNELGPHARYDDVCAACFMPRRWF